jgi:hypothetical protein
MNQYKVGLRLWDPFRDFKAYRELRGMGQLTFGKWLAGVLRRQTFAYFAWTDPMPAIARMLKPLRRLVKSRSVKPSVVKPAAVAKAAGEGALA